MKLKRLFILLTSSLLIFSFSLTATARPRGGKGKGGGEAAPSGLRYGGRVEPRRLVKQIAPFSGRVIRELVAPGSKVAKGQPVLVLARISLGQEFGEFQIKSNIAGQIDQFFLDPGTEFASGEPLVSLADMSKLLVKVLVSDKDQAAIKAGDSVEADFGGGTVKGKVLRKTITAQGRTGLFPVEVEFEPHPELYVGRFVSVVFPVVPAVEGGVATPVLMTE